MLWLARHGQTAYNAAGRFQGQLPVPLDDRGREQAGELAARAVALAPTVLVCSPVARAQETADIVGARLGLTPVADARFADTDSGDWTDETFEAVLARDPEGFSRFVALDMTWGFPGGERFAEQQSRVLAGIADWRAREPAGRVLIVCHGNSMRVAQLGLAPSGEATPERPDNGGLLAL